MIKVLEQAVEKIKALSRERQEYAAEVLEQIADAGDDVYRLSDEERRLVREGYDDIAQHNPGAAQRVEDTIRTRCERLADFPYAAVATDEPNVRRLPLVRYPYTIYYRIDAMRGLV